MVKFLLNNQQLYLYADLYTCDTCDDSRRYLTAPRNYNRYNGNAYGDADLNFNGNYMIAVGSSMYLSQHTEDGPVLADDSEFVWLKTQNNRIAKSLKVGNVQVYQSIDGNWVEYGPEIKLPVKPGRYMGVDAGSMKVSLSDDGQTAMVKCHLIKSSLYYNFANNYNTDRLKSNLPGTTDKVICDYIFVYDFDGQNWNVRDIPLIPTQRGGNAHSIPKMTGDGNHIISHWRGQGVVVYAKTENGSFVMKGTPLFNEKIENGNYDGITSDLSATGNRLYVGTGRGAQFHPGAFASTVELYDFEDGDWTHVHTFTRNQGWYDPRPHTFEMSADGKRFFAITPQRGYYRWSRPHTKVFEIDDDKNIIQIGSISHKDGDNLIEAKA